MIRDVWLHQESAFRLDGSRRRSRWCYPRPDNSVFFEIILLATSPTAQLGPDLNITPCTYIRGNSGNAAHEEFKLRTL